MENYYGTRRKRNLNYSGNCPVESGSINWDRDAELEEGEEIELEEDDDMELEADEEGEEIDYDEGEDANDDVGVNEDVTDDENQTDKGQLFYLDGKLFVPKGQKKKQSFAETHVRVTTYFEKNVLQIIRILQEKGQIESITQLVNDSVKAHLIQKYNDNI